MAWLIALGAVLMGSGGLLILLQRRPAGRRPACGEVSVAALGRQLRLEHVQIRELSGMMRRLLAGARDLEGARRLAGGLARRWDAHTAREEAELLGSAAQ